MRKTRYLLVLLLAGEAALAQASLKIQLTNALTGQPLKNHPVTVANLAIGFERAVQTNARGVAELFGLNTAGAYQVTVPQTKLFYGFESRKITLRSNQAASINLPLISRRTTELQAASVKAKRGVAQINTVNAEVSAELPEKQIQMLPFEARDITRVLYRLPNVSRATGFYPEAPNVSINGANSLFTSYLIDGMDNNERFLGGQRFAIPMGMVKNITVLANNYSAEYGQSANGVINVTTRSGSNELHGGAYYTLRPGPPLDASSAFATNDLYGRSLNDGFSRHQFGFFGGGAIVKDQTFFYLNAEQTITQQENLLNVPELNTRETINGSNYQTLVSARVDHYWNQKWRSTARLHYGDISLSRRGGGRLEPIRFREAGYTQERNSFTAVLQNVYTGQNLTAETNYQYATMDWLYLDPVNKDIPSVSVYGPANDQVPLAIVGETFGKFDLRQKTHQFQQKFTWQWGRHTLKAGIDVIASQHSDTRGGNGNGAYNVYLSQAQLDSVAALGRGADLSYQDLPRQPDSLTYSVELHPETFEGTQNIVSAYLEDRWALSSDLTLSLGLRYDFDSQSKAGSDTYDWNNLGPRVQANYQLNNRMSLRAGYGLFYDKIVYAVYSDALAGNSRAPDYRAQLQGLIEAGALPQSASIERMTHEGNSNAFYTDAQVDYLEAPTAEDIPNSAGYGFATQRYILNPNGLDNPYAHHFMLGYQYQINENLLFYTDLIYKRSHNQLRLVDVNAPAPFNVDAVESPADVRSAATADATRDVPIFTDAAGSYALYHGQRLDNAARKVYMTDAGGQARYYALNLNLVKDRGPDNYSYRIYYTLSRLENNTEDINFQAADANRFDREWGPGLNDRTHLLSAMGFFYPADGWSINVSSLIQSGQPVNRVTSAETFGTTDINGDGGSVATQYTGSPDRYPGESRNSDRLPWAVTFDAGLGYTFHLGPQDRHRLQLRASIFNLLNAENYTGYTVNFTQSNQFQTGPASSGRFVYRNAARPRQFQFSLRYSF